MRKTARNILGVVALVALSATVAGVTTYKLLPKESTASSFADSFQLNPAYHNAAFSGMPSQPVDLTAAAESSVHAVVHIRATQLSRTQTVQEMPDIFDFFFGDGQGRQRQIQTQPRVGFGSGVIISKDGYVVTNNHVVEGATSVTVKLYNGDEYDAEIVGTDEMNDVALLKIDATGLQAVTIGDSDQIEVGEEVIAIGNPLGELTFTMTAGVVSALDREINTDGKPINMLQTDVAINSGNSGGPLFDMNGNVIGITSAKYSGSTSSGASIEGISFAIPINDALRVIYDLQQYGRVTGRAYLGVTVRDLDGTTASTYGLPTGPMIQSVEAGGCAEKAGLQQGDIIIGFNGSEIASYTDLVAALNKLKAGDTATITVFRAGAQVEASITLDERPTDDEITAREQAQNEQSQQDNSQSGQQGQSGSGSDSSNGYSYGYGNMNPFEFFQQIPGFGN